MTDAIIPAAPGTFILMDMGVYINRTAAEDPDAAIRSAKTPVIGWIYSTHEPVTAITPRGPCDKYYLLGADGNLYDSEGGGGITASDWISHMASR